MKIIYTGYPLAQLTGGDQQKRAQARIQINATQGLVDTGPCSAISDKAVIRYLQAIDDITSDLLRIVDDYPQTGTAGDVSLIPDQLPREKAVNIPNMFIYYPPSDSGGESAGPGQIIVVQGCPSSSDAGCRELQGEQSVSDLVKTIVRQLSAVDKGIGLESVDIGSMPARDRFVIFAETKDGMPVISVIRQGASGRSELLDHDQIRDEAILNVITKLNVAITTGQPVKTPQPEGFVSGAKDAKGESVSTPAATDTRDTPDAGAPFNLPEIARAILSSVFSGGKHEGIVNNAKNQETMTLNEAAASALSDDAASDIIPGMIVRYITQSSPLSGIPDKTDPGARIIDNLISLEKLLEDVPGFDAPIDGLPEDDAVALEAVRASIKEKVPVMVRDALHAAGRNAQSAYPDNNAGPFGISIDERGLLKIDSTTLAESLSEKKDATIRYIQDFGNSLQDKIRYDFNPLAGLYTGGESTGGILKANRKHRADDECDDKQKIQLEKRLNEVQMLLKSSYELKDLFMQSKCADQPGAFDETDR